MPYKHESIDIPRLFPHRHPFLLIDRVLSIGPDSAIAAKAITRSEPWFTGHFPDDPVLPGVIMLEAMAQMGRFLTPLDHELVSSRLARIDAVRFFREARPGDVLRMEAQRLGQFGQLSKFHVDATIDGEPCTTADFLVTAELVPATTTVQNTQEVPVP